jgi:hypothetical protein
MPITYAPGVAVQLPALPGIPDDASVHVIPLNRGLYAIIDIADCDLISGWGFSASQQRDYWTIRAYRGSETDGSRVYSSLHTIITGFTVTDHKNGNTFDNRRSKLREATRSQNQANQTLQVNNKSGFKGVHWNETCQKWQAYIRIDGNQKHLGFFTDKMDAALGYDMAAREHNKSFAALNFPLIGERSAITGVIRSFDPETYPELVRR